jgi:maltooligosyltrehalose synthase
MPGSAAWPLGQQVWRSAALLLPKSLPQRWTNVLTGESLTADAGASHRELPLSAIFSSFPIALLSSR